MAEHSRFVAPSAEAFFVKSALLARGYSPKEVSAILRDPRLQVLRRPTIDDPTVEMLVPMSLPVVLAKRGEDWVLFEGQRMTWDQIEELVARRRAAIHPPAAE